MPAPGSHSADLARGRDAAIGSEPEGPSRQMPSQKNPKDCCRCVNRSNQLNGGESNKEPGRRGSWLTTTDAHRKVGRGKDTPELPSSP